MDDLYLYIIIALLPLTAVVQLFQVNPYHALVLRGILGAVAALVYAVLGAADVALTEALVGTMLAMMLYAVAVRSSLVMRLGVLADGATQAEDKPESEPQLERLLDEFQAILGKHHLRLELTSYTSIQSLQQALANREVHTICIGRSHLEAEDANWVDGETEKNLYQTTTRIQRLYDILQSEQLLSITSLTYAKLPETKASEPKTPDLEEAHR